MTRYHLGLTNSGVLRFLSEDEGIIPAKITCLYNGLKPAKANHLSLIMTEMRR